MRIFCLITLFFTLNTTFGQSDIKARIEFEEAERFFNQNNFEEAWNRLEKTENIIGKWTPKISYLKIEILNKHSDFSNFSDENTKKLWEEVNKYMDFYSKNNEAIIEDKFKNVYLIQQKLDSLKLEYKKEMDYLSRQSGEKSMTEYLEGKKAIDTQDYKNALQFFLIAAEKDNSMAMAELGNLYQNGLGVPQNHDEAIKWHQKALERGNPDGMNGIGNIYFFGYGVDKNIPKALEWYEKAAAKGNLSAMVSLGTVYHNGAEGIIRNYDKAKNWYQTALDSGYGEALEYMAVLYLNGFKDLAAGIGIYETMINKGNTSAMKTLAHIYETGAYGVPRDKKKAKKLMDQYELAKK